jgi:hypothetical protein
MLRRLSSQVCYKVGPGVYVKAQNSFHNECQARLMQHLDVLLLILVSAVASLLVLSRISRVPCPVLLVTGGVLLGFVPGVPRVQLSLEVMLLIFLPPLLFYEASIYQARQFKENLAAISLLAVGLWSGQLSEWRRWRTYWRAWTGALPSF